MRGLLLVALSVFLASCSQVRGRFVEIQPASGLVVGFQGYNVLPIKPSCSGGVVRYEFFSEDCLCRSNPVLVCKNPGNMSFSVNGHRVETVDSLHVFNHDDTCFLLSGLVHEGDNVIEQSGGVSDAEPLFLAGDFAVFMDNDARMYAAPQVLLALGDVVWQGSPYISGYMSYSRPYELPDNVRKAVLHIPHWEGSRCEVFANGEKISTVRRRQSRLKISSALRSGLNFIELRIYGFPFSSFERTAREFGLYNEYTITIL